MEEACERSKKDNDNNNKKTILFKAPYMQISLSTLITRVNTPSAPPEGGGGSGDGGCRNSYLGLDIIP